MSAYTISILVFLSVALAVYALGSPRAQLVRRRLERYGTEDELTEYDRQLERPFIERFLSVITDRIMALVRRMAPDSMADDIAARLMRAGNPMRLTVNSFLIVRAVFLMAIPV